MRLYCVIFEIIGSFHQQKTNVYVQDYHRAKKKGGVIPLPIIETIAGLANSLGLIGIDLE